ncbi:glycosyltransferase [Moorena producens]|uniref:glycosyltransferase n=1 Tax=Moorena producens TaxID=1155739 RepID=UPI003C7639DD
MTLARILYIQYTNPSGYPPLEHSSRILADEGWQVIFLGTGVLGASNLSFPPHPNITVRQLSFCLPGWRQKLHYIWFCIWVVGWTLRWQPQWVYASDLLACPISFLLSFLPNVQLIYHEHDSPVEIPKNLFMRLCFSYRQRLANRAKICILPNTKRVEWFAKSTNSEKKTICVWNCPRKEEVVQRQNLNVSQPIRLYYHGNISATLLPLSILDAIAITCDKDGSNRVHLRVVGYTTIRNEGYLEILRHHAKSLGIEENLQILSAVPRQRLLQLAHECDVGLALMPMTSKNVNLNFLIGASNKPFDYLSCGLPLLVSDLPDWKEMYVESGYGLAANPEDPDSIARALRWYLENPRGMRQMGENARKRILEEWNYEKQFETVKNIMIHGHEAFTI